MVCIHMKGIRHGDLKLSNIFLVDEDTVKFGLGRYTTVRMNLAYNFPCSTLIII